MPTKVVQAPDPPDRPTLEQQRDALLKAREKVAKKLYHGRSEGDVILGKRHALDGTRRQLADRMDDLDRALERSA
jgi:hypothetical protein